MMRRRLPMIGFLALFCFLAAAGCVDPVREGLAGGVEASIMALVEDLSSRAVGILLGAG